jgi:RNA polymerase sigma-70 factor (ECF subfamily)
VAVWQKIGRYDPARGEIRAWLLAIVRNRAVDGLRRVRPTAVVDDLEDALIGGGPNPTWDEAAERLSNAQLSAALRQLPDEQRTALDLAYFKGHTYREVAEITGVPPGTASSRMRLALARLREILAETDAAPFWDERATALEGEPR